MANQIVFNGKNLSSDITYDDVLKCKKIFFNIYKSDNGLEQVKLVIIFLNDAEEQLEEFERIKAQILEMEMICGIINKTHISYINKT